MSLSPESKMALDSWYKLLCEKHQVNPNVAIDVLTLICDQDQISVLSSNTSILTNLTTLRHEKKDAINLAKKTELETEGYTVTPPA